MAEQVFLEEWLRRTADTSSPPPPPPPAHSILRAWSQLRDSVQHQAIDSHLHSSLQLLFTSQKSLFLSDSQANLVISILSLPLLPHGLHPLLFRLLYVWARKSTRPSIPVISSALDVVSPIFLPPFCALKSPFLVSEGVLLLGAFSCVRNLPETPKNACLDLICRLLENEAQFLLSSETHFPETLAGIGYALSSSSKSHFLVILRDLLAFFHGKQVDYISISSGVMILHMIEWILSGFATLERIEVFAEALLDAEKSKNSPFSVIMAAAGALRASRKASWAGFPIEIVSRLKCVAEERIEFVARDLISEIDDQSDVCSHSDSLLLQCVSLALARSGPISTSPSSLFCLARALLTQVFPLRRFYSIVFDNSAGVSLPEVREHLNSTVFKDAGAITSVFCKVYVGSEEEKMNRVENIIWGYCHDVYSGHRRVSIALRKGDVGLLKDLGKIAESSFFMVIFFVFSVTKQRLTPNLNMQIQIAVSVSVLIALSCVEYFRRVRLPEYLDAIRAVVVCIRENGASAIISFIKSMPSYVNLTDISGDVANYVWFEDDVQTARISFYIRVIPTCIESIPASVFREMIASTMLLYMWHPNIKVSRASHTLFAAFISSGTDSDEDKMLLKEHLAFYYLRRSLEGFPGVTPFESMASGVVALILHLPAGCPCLFYCIHSLVEKAAELCRGVSDWKNEGEGEPQPWKNMLDLIIRLVELVDIQVLPALMKRMGKMTRGLPRKGQELMVSQLSSLVAESCDVTRKPILLPWLHCLSCDSDEPAVTDCCPPRL